MKSRRIGRRRQKGNLHRVPKLLKLKKKKKENESNDAERSLYYKKRKELTKRNIWGSADTPTLVDSLCAPFLSLGYGTLIDKLDELLKLTDQEIRVVVAKTAEEDTLARKTKGAEPRNKDLEETNKIVDSPNISIQADEVIQENMVLVSETNIEQAASLPEVKLTDLAPPPGKETGAVLIPEVSKELLYVTSTANPPESNVDTLQPLVNLSTKAPASKSIRDFFPQAPTPPPPSPPLIIYGFRVLPF